MAPSLSPDLAFSFAALSCCLMASSRCFMSDSTSFSTCSTLRNPFVFCSLLMTVPSALASTTTGSFSPLRKAPGRRARQGGRHGHQQAAKHERELFSTEEFLAQQGA